MLAATSNKLTNNFFGLITSDLRSDVASKRPLDYAGLYDLSSMNYVSKSYDLLVCLTHLTRYISHEDGSDTRPRNSVLLQYT
jgi:hypothetical protein